MKTKEHQQQYIKYIKESEVSYTLTYPQEKGNTQITFFSRGWMDS